MVVVMMMISGGSSTPPVSRRRPLCGGSFLDRFFPRPQARPGGFAEKDGHKEFTKTNWWSKLSS